jgi:rod shape determining protein RodA
MGAAPLSVRVVRTHPGAPPASARAITRPRLAMLNPASISVAAALALTLIGITTIALTEPALAMRQGALLVIGLTAAAVAAAPHYAIARHFSYPLLACTIVLLAFVLIPFVPEAIVRPRNGSRRWINLGVTDFQPSEIAKIAFILSLATYLRFRDNYRRLFGLIPPFVLTFIPMSLILVEPDLGTSLLFLPTLFAMLIAAGAKKRHIALIVAMGLLSAPAMYPLLQPYQKDRIHAMLHQIAGDTSMSQTTGYQGDRAITLIGAGGVTGAGAQAARDLVVYNHLPEEHNDMIFAVVGARWGLLGGVMVIGLYVLFILGGMLTAAACRDPFGRLVAVGIVAVVFAQMTVNIGMTIGLLPITGMTLPFVSYGGSSLVVTWMMTGLLYGIALRRPRYLERPSFEFADAKEDDE